MSQGVANRAPSATVGRVAESCPKAREFPEQLLVLLGLTVLVLALAAWAHAVDPQGEATIRTGTSLRSVPRAA
jgi:hypothetical protein